jgi:hypothetical protein
VAAAELSLQTQIDDVEADLDQNYSTTSEIDGQINTAAAALDLAIRSSVAASIGGVINSPYLEHTTHWSTPPVIAPNEYYPTGNTLDFDLTGGAQGGWHLSSLHPAWIVPVNPESFFVEVEFELLSGASLNGAGIILDWRNTAGDLHRQYFKMADHIPTPVATGQRTTARFELPRPSSFTGTFDYHNIFVMANYSAGLGGLEDKRIKFHRVAIGVSDATVEANLAEVAYTKSETDGQISTAIAANNLTLSSELLQATENVFGSPFLEMSRGPWGTAPSETPNEVYAQGNTWTWNVGAADNAGVEIRSDTHAATWVGPEIARAWAAEVEFELLSGAIDGAGVLFDFNDGTNHRKAVEFASVLSEPPTIGERQTVTMVGVRPASYSGPASFGRVYIMANFSGNGFTKAAKHIKFHRFQMRPATAEELGEGQVAAGIAVNHYTKVETDGEISTAVAAAQTTLQANIDDVQAEVDINSAAVVDMNGFAAAHSGTSVSVTGGKIAGFKATSWSDPDGSGGGTLELLGDVIAPGTVSTNALTVGLGQNLLSNTDFTDGLEGWIFNTSGDQIGASTMALRTPGQSWAGKYYPTLRVYQNTGPGGSGVANIRFKRYVSDQAGYIPVTPGQYIEASVHASAHRCTVDLRIQFYDFDQAHVGYISVDQTSGGGSSTDPFSWPRLWVHGVVPANAAYATIHMRKGITTSGSDSWAFYHQPQMCLSHADATEAAPYSPQGTTQISGGAVRANSVTSAHAIFASGAIQQADIGNAQVDTLQIKDRAVTIPARKQYTGGGAFSLGASWVDLLDVTLDREGYSTEIRYSCGLSATDNGGSGGDEGGGAEFRILRDGVVVQDGLTTSTVRYGRMFGVTVMAVDNDTGTGTATYKVQGRHWHTGVWTGLPWVHRGYISAEQFQR